VQGKVNWMTRHHGACKQIDYEIKTQFKSKSELFDRKGPTYEQVASCFAYLSSARS